jgi:hypothetical protein
LQDLYISVPATTVAADGTATVALKGFPASQMAKWNASVQCSKGVLSFLSGSQVIAGPVPVTNGGITLGPILTHPSDQVTVRLVGGSPGDTLIGELNGGSSTDLNELATGVQGVTYSTLGSTQSNPSALLSGQVGSPLIENLTVQIVHGTFVEFGALGNTATTPLLNPFANPFDVSGYGAVFLEADPNTAANELFAQIFWADSNNNFFATTQIGSIAPLARIPIACLGVRCVLVITNTGAANHAINNLSLIPLVSIPAKPDLLLDNGLETVGTLSAIDSHVLVASNGSIGAGATTPFVANFVWNGRAILHVGTGSVTWSLTGTATDASGNITPLCFFQNAAPVDAELQLPAALVTLSFHNNGAVAITPTISLLATS